MAPPTAKAEKASLPNITTVEPKVTIVDCQPPRLKSHDSEKYELGQYGTFDPRVSPARVRKEATRSILLAFLASLLVVTSLALVGIVGVGVFWY